MGGPRVRRSNYREGQEKKIHYVFKRADALMHKEKEALKRLGAKTR